MTDKIQINRSVLEQALDALQDADTLMEHRQDVELRHSAMAALRAALDQQQVEQEPVAWRLFDGDPFPGTATRHVYYDKDDFKEGVNPTEHFQLEPLYTHSQNLSCKSTQARLATLWGYEKPQPPRQPLTKEEIAVIAAACGGLASDFVVSIASAIEVAHGIGGEK